MRLLPTKPNGKDPMVLEYKDRTRILFSYELPVAAFVPERGYIVTTSPMSPTTMRRITDWIGSNDFAEVPQDEIYAVITDRPWYDLMDLA